MEPLLRYIYGPRAENLPSTTDELVGFINLANQLGAASALEAGALSLAARCRCKKAEPLDVLAKLEDDVVSSRCVSALVEVAYEQQLKALGRIDDVYENVFDGLWMRKVKADMQQHLIQLPFVGLRALLEGDDLFASEEDLTWMAVRTWVVAHHAAPAPDTACPPEAEELLAAVRWPYLSHFLVTGSIRDDPFVVSSPRLRGLVQARLDMGDDLSQWQVSSTLRLHARKTGGERGGL